MLIGFGVSLIVMPVSITCRNRETLLHKQSLNVRDAFGFTQHHVIENQSVKVFLMVQHL